MRDQNKTMTSILDEGRLAAEMLPKEGVSLPARRPKAP